MPSNAHFQNHVMQQVALCHLVEKSHQPQPGSTEKLRNLAFCLLLPASSSSCYMDGTALYGFIHDSFSNIFCGFMDRVPDNNTPCCTPRSKNRTLLPNILTIRILKPKPSSRPQITLHREHLFNFLLMDPLTSSSLLQCQLADG